MGNGVAVDGAVVKRGIDSRVFYDSRLATYFPSSCYVEGVGRVLVKRRICFNATSCVRPNTNKNSVFLVRSENIFFIFDGSACSIGMTVNVFGKLGYVDVDGQFHLDARVDLRSWDPNSLQGYFCK